VKMMLFDKIDRLREELLEETKEISRLHYKAGKRTKEIIELDSKMEKKIRERNRLKEIYTNCDCDSYVKKDIIMEERYCIRAATCEECDLYKRCNQVIDKLN